MRTSTITGVLNREVKGRFSAWDAGTRVRVFPQPQRMCADIERLDNPTGLLLMDMMAGVPLEAITLDEPCDECAGSGDVATVGKYGGTWVMCGKCGGSGQRCAATPAS